MGAIAGLIGVFPEEDALLSAEETMKRRGGRIDRLKTGTGCLLHAGTAGSAGICFRQKKDGETRSLVWSGNLYNREEVARELEIQQPQMDPAMLVLEAYVRWGEECLKHLNGVFTFAVWEHRKQRLFLARDPMGVRPLFYLRRGNALLFASEIKTLLAFPGVRAELDRQGAMELVLLGPGRLPGSGVFRGIRELEPGCCSEFEAGKLVIRRWWKLTDGPHPDSFPDTVQKVRKLTEQAVARQTRDLPQFGTFLSGGLDSSILTGICSRENRGFPTFSVDYQNNDLYFVPGKFQPDSDGAYIETMCRAFSCSHRECVLGPEQLYGLLKEAMEARDLPGMGDVDSSLLAFCREVKKDIPAVLSGECADEIFGGYPWFRDEKIRRQAGFPWAQNTAERVRLLNAPWPDAGNFVMEACLDTCRQADILPERDPEERRIRELVNLNMRWFMQTLIDRNDRMSAAAGLEVRVPFCDVKIAEYLYRIPWTMKDYGSREKGLLREAFRGLLPESVRLRKKSPYPKTFDPRYEHLVMEGLRKILLEDSPLWELVKREEVVRALEGGSREPWYGQLMRRPQFAAWLLQMNFWLKHYEVQLIL